MTVHYVKYAHTDVECVQASASKLSIAALKTSCNLLIANLRFTDLTVVPMNVSCAKCKSAPAYDLDILNRVSL